MRWSENDTYKFVKLYLSHENLWNPNDPYYKSKLSRQQGLKDIIQDFKTETGISMTEMECKMKLKSLRSTYTQEVTKIKQRSTPDRVYSPTMKWFIEWHNRFRTLNRRLNYASNEAREFDDDSCQKVWIAQDDHSDYDEGQVDPFIPKADDDYLLLLKSEQNKSIEETERPPYKVKKRKFKFNSSSSVDNSYRSSLEANDYLREDEFDIYGKYIASQLRKLDVQKAIKVQLEIQGIVSDARLSSLRSKH